MSVLRSTGVKGSDVYTWEGVGDPRVSLSTLLVRGATKETIATQLEAILSDLTNERLADAIVLAFQTRDIRGGKGERDLFYHFLHLLATHPKTSELTRSLFDLIPEYGSWYDVFALAEKYPELKSDLFEVAKKQYKADLHTCHVEGNNSRLSLLAKWAPREGKKFSRLASEFARSLGFMGSQSQIMKNYRHSFSFLNAALRTVEVFECADRWDEIVPGHVPGRARKIKIHAYLNEELKDSDTLREPENAKRMACRTKFQEFLKAAAEGKAKITGSKTLYPHQVVEKANHGVTGDEANELLAVWRTMVEEARAKGGLGRSLAMCDFSGSMDGLPIQVSRALGLLISEVTTEEFRDTILTFDSTPTLVKLPSGTLFDKLAYLRKYNLGTGLSTDFQKAMDLVLDRLASQRVKPGQEPENLIVLTDMGWDQAAGKHQQGRYTQNTYLHSAKQDGWETHVEMIRKAFHDLGMRLWGEPYTMPQIVIWNLSDAVQDFHASASTPGVSMLSGWSPSAFRVLQEKGPNSITPYETFRILVDDVRYAPIRERVQNWIGGGWRGIL